MFNKIPSLLAAKEKLQSVLSKGETIVDCEIALQQQLIKSENPNYGRFDFYPLREPSGTIFGVAAIVQDITNHKRALKLLRKNEERLKILTDELEKSNQALSAFAQTASHDLKEPLRTVNSYVQLLDRYYAERKDYQASTYMHHVTDGTARMHSLIEKTLEYARSENTIAKLVKLDLENLLSSVLEGLHTSIIESKVEITRSKLPIILGDKDLLAQVFQNLISNAIKFGNPKERKIDIQAERSLDKWIFSISDNGIGIPKEQFDSIFKPFKKLHARSQYAGSGLGLSICKKNIELHGGKIWLTSEEGKGTSFYFSLPINDPAQMDRHEK